MRFHAHRTAGCYCNLAILAAILFPVFAKAKERAQTAKCQNNLRQLASGMLLYADDNGGRLPNARVCVSRPSWEGSKGVGDDVDLRTGQIFKYTRHAELYLCPVDKKVKAEQITAAYQRKYPISYSMNFCLSYKVSSNIKRPTKMLLLIHESRSSINDGDFMWDSAIDVPSGIHYDGTTLVYLDGHSAWRSKKQLLVARAAREWDANM